MSGEPKHVVEAMLFAARAPVPEHEIGRVLPEGYDARQVLADLASDYDGRGIAVVRSASGWCIRTRQEASDIAAMFAPDPPRISKAALETLAVIAVFEGVEPVTRSEIERIRGVGLSPGVLDALLEAGWVRPGRRRDTPGRPLTWTTTPKFLDDLGIMAADDLPAVAQMKAAGLAVVPPPKPAAPAQDGQEPQA